MKGCYRRVVTPELRLDGTHTGLQHRLWLRSAPTPAFYGQFEQNAPQLVHLASIQEGWNAHVNPPIDRHKPADEVKDVYIKLEKETDAGLLVSGRKLSPLTPPWDSSLHNMIGFGSARARWAKPDFA